MDSIIILWFILDVSLVSFRVKYNQKEIATLIFGIFNHIYAYDRKSQYIYAFTAKSL